MIHFTFRFLFFSCVCVSFHLPFVLKIRQASQKDQFLVVYEFPLLKNIAPRK